ncbi:MAG: tetratricopeptide repeat protein [Candidatus Hodarchaeales archaeon]|jgi:tetratricopeptide (TPR) repeat protein
MPKMNIQKSLTIFMISIVAISSLLLSLTIGININSMSNNNANDSTDALLSEALDSLDRTASDQATYLTETFKQWSAEITILDNYTEAVLADPSDTFVSSSYYWTDQNVPNQKFEPDYDSASISFDVSTYYIPPNILQQYGNDINNVPDSIKEWVNKTSKMDQVFRNLHAANPQWVWLYGQFATAGHIFRNYPFDDLSYFYDSSSPDYLPDGWFNDDWYLKAASITGTDSAFISPYGDPVTGLLMSVTRPIHAPNGTLLGVVGGDVAIDELRSNVVNIKFKENGYAYLMDKTGEVISHPELLDSSQSVIDLEFSNNGEKTAFQQKLQDLNESNGRMDFQKNNEKWYLSYHSIEGTDFIVMLVVPESDVIAPALSLQNQIAFLTFGQLAIFGILIIVVLLVVIFAGFVISQRIVQPIKNFTKMTKLIAEGDLSRDMKSEMINYEVEISALGTSLSNLLTSLRMGNQNYYRGDLNRAFDNYSQLLELFKTTDNQRGIALSLNNLANIYKSRGDHDKAKDYYLEAISIGEKMQDKKGLASRLNNLALLYMEKGPENFVEAENLLKDAIELDQQIGNYRGMITRFGNLGLLYQKLGNDSLAFSYFQKQITTAEYNDVKSGFGYGYYNLGTYHRNQKDYSKAIEELKKAYKHGKKYEDFKLVTNSLKELSLAYEQSGDKVLSHKARVKIEKYMDQLNPSKIISFVIDYSSSMSGNRNRSAINGVLEIIKKHLNPQDQIQIIKFNEYSDTVLKLQKVSKNKEKILRKVSNLRSPNGMTAFYDALGDALVGMSDFRGNEQRWVIALTDGEDNRSTQFHIKSRRFGTSLWSIITSFWKDASVDKDTIDDSSIQGYMQKHLLNLNLIILGIGELSYANDLRRITDESPRGMYISIGGGQGSIDELSKAFSKVDEMMAEIDVEGLQIDDY